MADLMEEEAEAEFMALPQVERLEIILNGAQIRSHLGDCPLVKAEPIDFSDIPF